MHYSDYTGPWPWPSFTPREIACRCCGELYPGSDPEPPKWLTESMDTLQELRDAWGEPMVINSGHRCILHNAQEGGVLRSQHLKVAFDVRCGADAQNALVMAAGKAGFTGIGRYPTARFVHLDCRPYPARWFG